MPLVLLQVETIRSNVIGCLNLADVCLSKGIHMTYYGTGCIFHYDDEFTVGGKGFMESDKPNFTGSYYSYTKVIQSTRTLQQSKPEKRPRNALHALAQMLLHQQMQEVKLVNGGHPAWTWCLLPLRPARVLKSLCAYLQAMVESLLKEYPNVLTLRVRMPIVEDLCYPRNFITKIIKYDKVIDIPNSMTVLPELLPYSIEMVSMSSMLLAMQHFSGVVYRGCSAGLTVAGLLDKYCNGLPACLCRSW